MHNSGWYAFVSLAVAILLNYSTESNAGQGQIPSIATSSFSNGNFHGLKEVITQQLSLNGTMVNSGRARMLFNVNDDLIRDSSFSWQDSTSAWKLKYVTTFDYYKKGKIAQILEKKITPDSSANLYLTTIHYNQSDSVDIVQQYDWDSVASSWKTLPTAVENVLYNANRKIDSILIRYYGSFGFFETIAIDYLPDGRINLETILTQASNSTVTKKAHYYPDSLSEIIIGSDETGNNSFTKKDSTFIRYDRAGNQITKTVFSLQFSVKPVKTSYDSTWYNAGGSPVWSVNFMYDPFSSSLFSSSTESYYYESQGIVISLSRHNSRHSALSSLAADKFLLSGRRCNNYLNRSRYHQFLVEKSPVPLIQPIFKSMR
jgi:hypothetical protein